MVIWQFAMEHDPLSSMIDRKENGDFPANCWLVGVKQWSIFEAISRLFHRSSIFLVAKSIEIPMLSIKNPYRDLVWPTISGSPGLAAIGMKATVKALEKEQAGHGHARFHAGFMVEGYG